MGFNSGQYGGRYIALKIFVKIFIFLGFSIIHNKYNPVILIIFQIIINNV